MGARSALDTPFGGVVGVMQHRGVSIYTSEIFTVLDTPPSVGHQNTNFISKSVLVYCTELYSSPTIGELYYQSSAVGGCLRRNSSTESLRPYISP